MKHSDKTRANDFDRRCGDYQIRKVMELGVGSSILDIGCGWGEFTKFFTGKFNRIVGLDPSEEFIKEAERLSWRRSDADIEWIIGWGETFKIDEKFDTITMMNLLEHVENPVALLKNCKKHLNNNGVIIVQVPNAKSITRRLGVIMGIIDSIGHISDRERDFFGHKRAYTPRTLKKDCIRAGLKILDWGGVLYKPLPNEMLEIICQEQGREWTEKFMDALYKFGRDRADECAYLYVLCQ